LVLPATVVSRDVNVNLLELFSTVEKDWFETNPANNKKPIILKNDKIILCRLLNFLKQNYRFI